MENTQDLSIDLTMFATSLITLRENLTYSEFDGILRDITRANDRGKLEELLNEAKFDYSQGTDLASAFSHALFDIIVEQGEDY